MCVFWDEAGVQPLVSDSIRNLGEVRIKQSTRLWCRGKEVTAFGNGAALLFTAARHRMSLSALFTAHLARLNVVGLGCFSP